jgi:hypothetical protein
LFTIARQKWQHDFDSGRRGLPSRTSGGRERSLPLQQCSGEFSQAPTMYWRDLSLGATIHTAIFSRDPHT